ncbi:Protein FAR-RED ELONGATED HYPOCOTYL like, partial [Actinidia chinensis var. chinensis]
LNKKRKYQGEQLGLPPPKHYCWDQSLSSESDSPSNENLTVEDFNVPVFAGKEAVGEEIYDESKLDSAKDRDNFGGGTDTSISSSNRPSHLSVSLDDISVTKSRADKKKAPYIGGEHDYALDDFGVHPCASFDDHLLEFYSCLEDGNDDNMERLVNMELDDMLNANKAGPSTTFVLSSNQETQLSPKKLTIDKEFEQYFSTLLM